LYLQDLEVLVVTGNLLVVFMLGAAAALLKKLLTVHRAALVVEAKELQLLNLQLLELPTRAVELVELH
jgi:hypothetical protein